MSPTPQDLASSLRTLSIHPTPSKSASSFKTPQKPSLQISSTAPDSWDDADSGSETETEPAPNHLKPHDSFPAPSAPPPTPISPATAPFEAPFGYQGDAAGDVKEAKRDPDRREEKTNAVASRMIAGALGIKAPKRTEEQKAYDKAIKEKELKRRREEKEAAEHRKIEAEKAKQSVWED